MCMPEKKLRGTPPRLASQLAAAPSFAQKIPFLELDRASLGELARDAYKIGYSAAAAVFTA